RIMLENVERHGVTHQKRLYGPYGDKVIDYYATLKSKGKPRNEIIFHLATRISSLGSRNVSSHAGDPSKLNVIDIAPGSIDLASRKAFESAVNADERVSKFLTPPKDPAYHLEISQP